MVSNKRKRERVEPRTDARRLMEEVLDAAGRGDEAKPTIGQPLDSASGRSHIVHLCGRGREGRQRAEWRCCMKTLRGGALLVTLRRSHTIGMQSKVHPTYKTKYRVANWPAYNQALVRRGDVTVWVSSEAIAAWTPRRPWSRSLIFMRR